MGLKKAAITKMGILSSEVGNLITEVRKLREEVIRAMSGPFYVSVILLGECIEGGRRREVVLAETYSLGAKTDWSASLDPMMPVAPGAWLVVVGAPILKYVRVGRDLQMANVGHGAPVIKLVDGVQVGQRVEFVISWDGKLT